MEYADYLYGLTMERAGQSKIVSVRLADLEKLDAVL
jgi:chromosome segregation ATPase